MARSTNLERLLVNHQLAENGSYSNTLSGLTATSVKGAIDEVEGRVETAETKLSGVETGATADQTDAEIKTAYENNSNTNAFTDSEKTKLGTVETNAAADQVASEVPVTLTATNYTASASQVEAHLVGLHTAIGSLQTQLVGGVTYKGGYNASANTPDLEDPTAGAVQVGDMFTVTADGDFFTVSVSIGDVIISEVDDPSAEGDWTIVENNIEDAADVSYNNGTSGLTATNVQTAVDEVDGRVDTLESDSNTDYVKVNSTGTNALALFAETIAIGSGASSNAAAGISIGQNAESGSGDYSIAIGFNSATQGGEGGNFDSIAIGKNAKVDGGQTNAVQIGEGINSLSNTLQFNNSRLANSDGLYTSHTAVNYTASDADNVTSHLSGIDTELGIKQDALPQAWLVNEETVSANKTLVNSDSIYQHLLSNTSGLEITLPSSPVNGTHFLIKSNPLSSEGFSVTGGPSSVTLNAGNIYEVVYTGTTWMVI